MTKKGKEQLFQDLKIVQQNFQRANQIIWEAFQHLQEVFLLAQQIQNHTYEDTHFLRVKNFFLTRMEKDLFTTPINNFLKAYRRFDEKGHFEPILFTLQQTIEVFEESIQEEEEN
ncbi:hypothetical protein C6B37_02725 [Candidatus Phytoplasma phoenicium]|uniref:HEPN domain-containing protein n=1 Tax=Candidatus Phytoplasma phoenicium TaxID=198422 RepID=A0A2S8NST3_9MOLU|nr:hypothetical protein C6B37_02725 [Candidatus Phytoplasma phoenicium]